MDHRYYMQKAIELAAKGWPYVASNPMVGCVIVKEGEIVAEGYHQRFGEAHAEVNAIKNLPVGVDPAECTLYVTLEPCSHYGKTAPCADLVINTGFKKVIVGCQDPNPLVAGKGIARLREHGIEVKTGFLENENKRLNRRFFTFFEEKRPYITLKWAITEDGFIGRQDPPDRASNRITREPALVAAHQLRAESMAILVGKNTVLTDDPSLTTRLVNGPNPLRLIIDGNLEAGPHHKILNGKAPTVVFNYLKDDQKANVRYCRIDKKDVLHQILGKLYTLNVQTLMVEGGAKLLQDFIDNNLWDEAWVFQNPDLFFNTGIKAPVFPLKNTFKLVGEDKLFVHYRGEKTGSGGENEIF